MKVEDLIQLGIDERERQAEEIRRAKEERIAELEGKLEERLGEAWVELKPYSTMSPIINYGNVIGLVCEVYAIDLQLIPFDVKITEDRVAVNGAQITINEIILRTDQQIGYELSKLRALFPEWNKRRREERIKQLSDRIRYYGDDLTQYQANEIYMQLSSIDPENHELWLQLRDHWQDQLNEKIDNFRAEAEYQEFLESCAAKYRQTLTDWQVEVERINQENQRWVDEIQAQIPSFKVCKLIYSMIGPEQDVPHTLVTKTIAVRETPIFAKGYWSVVEHGKTRPLRIFNPVSLSDEIEIRPGPNTREYDVDPVGHYHFGGRYVLHYGPNYVMDELRLPEIAPLPIMPNAPEGLRENDACRIEREFLSHVEWDQ